MESPIKRGDIFLADLSHGLGSEKGFFRPVVVIQNDIANKYSPTVITATITSQINVAKLPTHIRISSEEYGFNKDSVILLELIHTLDKRKLKEKIGHMTYNDMAKIDEAMDISLGRYSGDSQLQILEENLPKAVKPLVITEGKTDVQLIRNAWQKLYPSKEMFFECQASGIEVEEGKRQGSADNIRRAIEYFANLSQRPIIGLFDNDREGNEQFKGLNKKLFEKYDIKNSLRKHISTDIWGMLLPVPNERKLFVTDDDITQRYFVIEHYFSDDILKEHSMFGNTILGTSVFKVANRKDAFSKEVENLDAKAFENFKILFAKIEEIFTDN